MAVKTNAVRLVQQAGICCEERFYEYDEEDLSGTHAADAIGMPQEQVFKTLVARGERTGINVFCISVCCELDLKKAAKAVGEKSITMLPAKELLPLTGYVHGGCSPVRTCSGKYGREFCLTKTCGTLWIVSWSSMILCADDAVCLL